MTVKQDNAWASQYILDPLTAIEAWQETGPYQQAPASSVLHKPSHDSFYSKYVSSRKHHENRPSPRSTYPRSPSTGHTPRPLEQIRRENSRANRAPHLKRSSIPGPDIIDRLDNILGGVPYHHEGPFDATLLARQIPGRGPVEALSRSNAEAIAATPKANLVDSLERHRPLQGTASVPPGMMALGGEIMPDYEEYDVMRRDGNYKRYPGVEYLDDDLKGKGEPGYTLDEFDKQQKAARKARKTQPSGHNGYGLRPGSTSGAHIHTVPYELIPQSESGGVRRNKSSVGRMESGGSLGDKLKKRFNLKRRLT